MELNKVNILINKYFDGNTSRDEELALAKYFAECDYLPDNLLSVKQMFESLHVLSEATPKTEVTKQPTTPRWRVYARRIGMGVAASVIFAISLIAIFDNRGVGVDEPKMDFICYVDGHEIDDWQVAQAEADRILSGVADNMQQAMSGINMVEIAALKNKN